MNPVREREEERKEGGEKDKAKELKISYIREKIDINQTFDKS